jgi:hypothetical protein
MLLEDFIITVYCVVDENLKKSLKDKNIRKSGPSPSLTDSEVITMEIIGEYLSQKSDTAIWNYFKMHWLHFFPKIGHRTSFLRQCANLYHLKQIMQKHLSDQLCQDQDIYLFDGFPIPTCHLKRYKRSHTNLRYDGRVGYCAAKDLKYFGFKGHLLITQKGIIKNFTVTSASVDERDVVPELTQSLQGHLIADKGLIRPELKQQLASGGLYLHTPLRKNMTDNRPKAFVHKLMDIRRKVETVISQLTDRFNVQKIKAKDMWHLCSKIGRKIMYRFVNLKFSSD